jgi:hypothetical protein
MQGIRHLISGCVSRHFLAASARFQAQSVRVAFTKDKVSLAQVCLQVLRFLLTTIITPL